MARSVYSPSPSPVSPSPSFSDSSVDDNVSVYNNEQSDHIGPSISRPGSPTLYDSANQPDIPEHDDSVTCLWEDCGLVYTHLPTLIEHIHNDHIGVHKSNYTCEWATCTRRGLAQTSRFALISHIRSHTGEKPFTCPRPECDKSFTRSDALAKHMRLQHNISPPAPGRGGSRKRKRGTEDQPPPPPTSNPQPNPHSHPHHTDSDPHAPPGFNTFKVEPHTPSELADDDPRGEYFSRPHTNGRRSPNPNSGRRSASPNHHYSHSPPPADDSGYDSNTSDALPAHLLPHLSPTTNLILGRSPSMVMYLLMKAKHRYAIEQHEDLLEELRVARAELRRVREEKEGAVDQVLRGLFGPQAETLIAPVPLPPSMSSVGSGIGLGLVGYQANGNGSRQRPE